jgi:hypothetical protein
MERLYGLLRTKPAEVDAAVKAEITKRTEMMHTLAHEVAAAYNAGAADFPAKEAAYNEKQKQVDTEIAELQRLGRG